MKRKRSCRFTMKKRNLSKTIKFTFYPGYFEYRLHGYYGILHRTNGPAEINPERKRWYRHGKLHRKNGPAVEMEHLLSWYENGMLHRENDLPAHISSLGTEWWTNGKLHRDDDNPAVVEINRQMWYKHGQKHRFMGPAVIYNDGDVYYFIYGKQYRKEEFDRVINTMKSLIKNIKIHRFVKLCRSEAFCRVFYAEGQLGRKWDNAKIEKFSDSL